MQWRRWWIRIGLLAGLACAGLAGATAAEAAPPRHIETSGEAEDAEAGVPDAGKVARLRELAAAARGTPREFSLLNSLYIAERKAGNHFRAEQLRAQVLEHPESAAGPRLNLHFFDAQYHAGNANIRKAREQWDAGSAVLAGIDPASPKLKHYGPRYRARQDWALAAILRVEGHAEEARKTLERALASNAEDLRYFSAGAGKKRPQAEHDRKAAQGIRASLLSELITLQITMGRLGAAELVTLEWVGEARAAGDEYQLTLAIKRYGDVLLAAGRFEQAMLRFDEVLARQAAEGLDATSLPGLRTRRNRALALLGLERWEEAHEAFRSIERTTRYNQAARELLGRGIERALARAMAGHLPEAEKLIDAALAKNQREFGPDHLRTIRVEGMQALIHARFGRDERARPLFRRYVEAVGYSLVSADPALEESAIVQLRHRMILEAYLAVLLRRVGQEAARMDEAFRVADALHASRVQQAVTAAAVRSGTGDPALMALLREEQDLGHVEAALYRTLSEGPDGAAPDVALGQQLREIEGRRAALQEAIRQQFPAYTQLTRPSPPSPADAARHLASHEALLLISSSAAASYVFMLQPDGRIHVHQAMVGERRLAELVRRVRAALDVGDTPLDRLPPFDIAAAHEIYRLLLAPLPPLAGDARHLIVSANGSLAQVPFALLAENAEPLAAAAQPFAEYAAVAWLGRRYAISHIPSVAALVALRRLPPAASGRQPFVGFGDPDFGGVQAPRPGGLRNLRRPETVEGVDGTLRTAYRTLAPLPDTREEILTLARTLEAPVATTTFLDSGATRANALSPALTQARVVAFATHGLQPGELPGLDQPALALTMPKSGEVSPLLTLEDVLGIKLDADWVVLSACNTAGGEGEAAEALSGLGRGFFFAGARAILVTHWPVETESARRLVSAIFRRYTHDPTLSRAEALQEAQYELMQASGNGYSLAHPLFWAPYALIGDGGR